MDISVLIPTLNAERVLESCLESISKQNLGGLNLEIIIADGGSTDSTLDIAKKYNAVVIKNKLKTGESGKKAALNKAKGRYSALIDSDNILPTKNWFKEMIKPLEKHEGAVGSEPWEYTWRKDDGFITRYCALIGMNDPLVHFLGNYDRINLLTKKWTEVEHEEKDYKNYVLAKFDKRGLPTIGANGTVFRTDFLKKNAKGPYLFDIDILSGYISEKGSVEFVKVKNGIIHTFCESDIRKFARKQRRRVKDFLFHQWVAKDRDYGWYEKDLFGKDPWGLIKFILSCLTIFPLIVQTIIGFLRKPDIAWLFHPLACEITLWEYSWGRILGFFKKSEISRESWGQ